MEPGSLTAVLNSFISTFTLGITRVTPDALQLLRWIVTIELAFMGLWIALGHLNELSMAIVTVALKLTFYAWMVTQWQMLTRLLVRAFILMGLTASGNVIQETTFTNPSALVDTGLAATALVYNRIFSYSGFKAIYYLPDIFITGLVATLLMIAFGVFAIQVFVTLLEFYALSSVIIVLIPFGFTRWTSFVAEKAIALVWAYALKLLILSFITGVALPHIVTMSPEGIEPKFDQLIKLGITAWALVILAWRAPLMAQGLLSGAPQLTAETVTRAMQSSVRTVQNMANIMRGAAGTPAPAPVSTGRRRP